MTGGEVARRYAKALVVIAEERSVLDETGADLNAIADALLGHAGLRRVLENPRFPRAARTRLIENVLESSGTSPLLREFMRVVIGNDRTGELRAIAAKFQELADRRRGRMRAQVRSAHDLDKGAVGRLQEKLSRMTGSEIILEVERDDSLIGGLVCRVGSTLLDGSIRNQLRGLREKLLAN